MKTLSAHEQPVARLFSDDYVFNIPGYQRPYAWTTEQAGELFDDLLTATQDDSGPVEGMSPYFLGSIVLIKSDGEPAADVVDGQQRLTTLTILLAAIRASVNSKDAAGITALICEAGNPILGTIERYRLALRERDREFFQHYVQNGEGFKGLLELSDVLSDSQRNVRQNAKLLHERLSSLGESDRLRLARFVATRCFLVVVATPDLDAAYRIFSVLNSRGLDLSATDILKARIIGGLPERLRASYTKKWEDAEEDLGRDAFSELFSHIRMIYRKAKPQGTVLKEFTDHVSELATPKAFIDDVLLPASDAYEEIRGAAYQSTSHADAVNESLRWLNRLEFTDWVPPALAFAIRHRNNSERMRDFFRDLERLAYALMVMKVGVNRRIERFSELTRDIEQQGDLVRPESRLQLSAAEQAATYAALDGPVYENFSARARTAILLRLDTLLSAGGATYDYNVVSVEHVLPQTPEAGSEWFTWFPDPVERLGWVHRLGNLALLSHRKNSAAQNFSFDVKKTKYFVKDGVSPFVITTQVLGKSDWTPRVLQARQDELLARLEEHWRLQGRAPTAERVSV